MEAGPKASEAVRAVQSVRAAQEVTVREWGAQNKRQHHRYKRYWYKHAQAHLSQARKPSETCPLLQHPHRGLDNGNPIKREICCSKRARSYGLFAIWRRWTAPEN